MELKNISPFSRFAHLRLFMIAFSALVVNLTLSPTAVSITSNFTGNSTKCQQVPQSIKDNFEIEGKEPNPYSSDGCSLVFEPLKAKITTKNGHGYRQEFKIKDDDRRVGMTKTTELLTAIFKTDMSNGSKAIIAQYHNGDEDTIAKVYVSDTQKDLRNTIIDGVFEVFVRITPEGKSEKTKLLGKIKPDQAFSLSIKNEKGLVTISAFGNSVIEKVADGKNTYLKFGNYLQSQDPKTNANCGPPFEECYKKFNITKSKVTMSNISYSRN